MANGVGKVIGKSIVLLFLLVILIFVGLMWFDYLSVIHIKPLFAPIYKILKLSPQQSSTVSDIKQVNMANLDDDRLAKRQEHLDLREQELDKREQDIEKQEAVNLQVSQELEDLRISQEEREKTFNNEVKKYDDRNTNIEQISTYLQSMPPKTAVEQLLGMDDQDIIDILRKTDALAEASRTASMTSVWLMNMPAERAAVIQRKMASKPEKLD